LPDDFLIPVNGWNDAESHIFFDQVIPAILAEAAADAQAVSRSLPNPYLKTKVGPSTVSPTPGQLRAAIDFWIDTDLGGTYAGFGVRGNLARVAMWLGGAGDPLAMAKQVRTMQDFLVEAVERTRGLPMVA
jgi:hypothetical protein